MIERITNNIKKFNNIESVSSSLVTDGSVIYIGDALYLVKKTSDLIKLYPYNSSELYLDFFNNVDERLKNFNNEVNEKLATLIPSNLIMIRMIDLSTNKIKTKYLCGDGVKNIIITGTPAQQELQFTITTSKEEVTGKCVLKLDQIVDGEDGSKINWEDSTTPPSMNILSIKKMGISLELSDKNSHFKSIILDYVNDDQEVFSA